MSQLVMKGIPLPENVASELVGSLIADVYAVIRKDSQSESGPRKLLQWLLSTEGQAFVKQSGYVPILRM